VGQGGVLERHDVAGIRDDWGRESDAGQGDKRDGLELLRLGHRYATNPAGPWDVGSGSQELNGTYDMMGNVQEWMESPWTSGGLRNHFVAWGAWWIVRQRPEPPACHHPQRATNHGTNSTT